MNFLKIKEILIEWKNDILAGISFSSVATWLKYALQHFIDIGWTVTAALAVMLATHYGKKYLIPASDRLIKRVFKV
jgi:hypothetical protein